METLPYEATLLALLGVFSRGVHRGKSHNLHPISNPHLNPPHPVLIRASDPSSHTPYLGFVSDASALAHLAAHADCTPPLAAFLANALGALELPSLHLGAAVVAAPASASVLEAMRLMSEEGVSSVAVLEDPSGALLSAVSVTDIGKVGVFRFGVEGWLG